jgi:hypothetical protein
LIAETVPTGSATASQMTSAPAVSEIVAGRRETIACRTLSPLW